MQPEYWLKRWEEGRTGWHQETVLPLLEKHWPKLSLPSGTRVLVPFCGKSLDMLWLARQGFRVLGVEVSPLAVEQFFNENSLQPIKTNKGKASCYQAGNIEIVQGDLFDMGSEHLASCGAIYDRAALIAQPPDERERYAGNIHARLPSGCRGLLITLEYPQTEMDGPPFPVGEAEVQHLLNNWAVTLAERRDILNRSHFREAGLTSLHTTVYQLHRH